MSPWLSRLSHREHHEYLVQERQYTPVKPKPLKIQKGVKPIQTYTAEIAISEASLELQATNPELEACI